VIALVDGRSGSGKTELARLLGLPILRMDDLYPGWGGLQEAAEALPEILRTRRWQRWDWAASRPAEWNELPDGDLVVEGCGSLTAASRSLADLGVWVEHPASSRRQRALRREPAFAAHWDDWAAQEEAHIARANPRARADVIVDGADVTRAIADLRARLGA
jgi:hypothetical protein